MANRDMMATQACGACPTSAWARASTFTLSRRATPSPCAASPFPIRQRLKGHSDADVAMHALTDAILGAIGEGDIGTHFPPSDPQWKGAASRIFLEKAVELLHAKGGVHRQCRHHHPGGSAEDRAPYPGDEGGACTPAPSVAGSRSRSRRPPPRSSAPSDVGRHHGLCDGHGPAAMTFSPGLLRAAEHLLETCRRKGRLHCHRGKLHGRADRRRSDRHPWIIGCGRLRLRDLLERMRRRR